MASRSPGVVLTDEQYGALMRALCRIAKGRKVNRSGHSYRLCRDELVTEAREACDAARINWQSEIDDIDA